MNAVSYQGTVGMHSDISYLNCNSHSESWFLEISMGFCLIFDDCSCKVGAVIKGRDWLIKYAFTFFLQHSTCQHLPHRHRITFPLWLVCTHSFKVQRWRYRAWYIQVAVCIIWFEVVGELHGCRTIFWERIRAVAKTCCMQELWGLGACSPPPSWEIRCWEITSEADLSHNAFPSVLPVVPWEAEFLISYTFIGHRFCINYSAAKDVFRGMPFY